MIKLFSLAETTGPYVKAGDLSSMILPIYEHMQLTYNRQRYTQSMNIHFLQHTSYIGPGVIKSWAEMHGNRVSSSVLFRRGRVPDPSSIDVLIVLGSDIHVSGNESNAEQRKEKTLIRKCIRQNKLVLGINLGARLIASVLGARILLNRVKKMGWYLANWNSLACRNPMFNFLPCRQMVLYWHKYTYELPVGAIRLASSSHCKNQAFLYGNNVMGLQFHLEIDHVGLEQLILHHKEELKERGPHIQSAEHIIERSEYLDLNQHHMTHLLDRFILGKLDTASGMISAD